MKRLTRRQLIKTLAWGTTIASVSPAISGASWALPAAAGNGKGFRAVAVNHISYNVKDYARSRDFYAELLGMKLAFDDGKQCSLEFGDPPNALYIRNLKNAADKAYVDHMAYSIANFDLKAMEGELKKRGLNPKYDGNHAWTIHDPDGFTIQICDTRGVYPGQAAPGAPAEYTGPEPVQPPGTDKGPFRAVAVSHISYNSTDYARSRDFYRNLLGMKVIYDDGKQVRLQFGDDCLYVHKTKAPNEKANIDHLAYTISRWDKNVEVELSRRGLQPKPDSKFAWTIQDPDGYTLQVAAKEMVEHMIKDCHGSVNECPGGPAG